MSITPGPAPVYIHIYILYEGYLNIMMHPFVQILVRLLMGGYLLALNHC